MHFLNNHEEEEEEEGVDLIERVLDISLCYMLCCLLANPEQYILVVNVEVFDLLFSDAKTELDYMRCCFHANN